MLRSSSRRRAGSASRSISTTLPATTVKPARPPRARRGPCGRRERCPDPPARRRRGRALRRAPRSRRRGRRRGTPRPRRADRRDPDRAREPPRAPALARGSRASGSRPASARRRRDLVEGEAEHVVEHEREPLWRCQGLEHDQQREPHRVGQKRLLLGVEPLLAAHDRLRHVRAEGFLAARFPGARHVETDTCDHGREPPAGVLDAAGVRTTHPRPRLLKGVVGFAQRPEHPSGHRPQVGAVSLEPLRQVFAFVHCHIPSSSSVIAMTNPSQPT